MGLILVILKASSSRKSSRSSSMPRVRFIAGRHDIVHLGIDVDDMLLEGILHLPTLSEELFYMLAMTLIAEVS
jgi:hypothetical protein